MNRVLVCILAVSSLSACSQRSGVTDPGTTPGASTTNSMSSASTTVVPDKAIEQESSERALRLVLSLDYSLRTQATVGLPGAAAYLIDMRTGTFANMILENNQQFGDVKISAIGADGERFMLWDSAATGTKVEASSVVWAYEVTTAGVSACAWIGENASMPAVVQTGTC